MPPAGVRAKAPPPDRPRALPATTPLVRRLLLLWVAVWLAESLLFLGGLDLAGFLALRPADLLGLDVLALPGLVTYAVAHAPFPTLLHLAVNAYLLWVFGGEVETLWPGRRFLAFLGWVVLVGAGVHLLLVPLMGASMVLGGSGIVNAVLAANAAMYPGRILDLILLRCRLITFFLVWLAVDVLRALYMAGGMGTGVAADVHLAGAAVGWIWAGGLERHGGPFRGIILRWRGRQAEQARRRAREEEAELDRILAKIGREGLSSLSPRERRFLERRSGRGRR